MDVLKKEVLKRVGGFILVGMSVFRQVNKWIIAMW